VRAGLRLHMRIIIVAKLVTSIKWRCKLKTGT